MIKHKGYRIAAAEIERVLQEHHAVLSACAVGVPDEKRENELSLCRPQDRFKGRERL